MLFSSITFIFYFLPCVLFLYFIVPRRFKNSVLLIASLFFYGWGEPKYIVVMVITIIIAYFLGRCIEKNRGNSRATVYLTLAVIYSLGTLIYFKYWDFFVGSFNSITGLDIKLLNIALPIGISFYTFQLISYIIDVYRGEVEASKNIINLATYITMFPQLVAGPIVRYSQIDEELRKKNISILRCAYGIRRFIIGLSKKILIANVLGQLCNAYKDSNEKTVLFVWLYALCFMLQVYFDFSGYSDMAIGLGKILGFDFPENFDYPYISKSITEFWRRWHVTLGNWFRDYVYIPLGGNRVSKHRHIFNLVVVWLLTGLWHGASTNFVIWGVYFAILLILEKYCLKRILDKSSWISHVYVLFLCLISFIIFDAESLIIAVDNLKSMFGLGRIPLVSSESIYYLRSYFLVILIGIIASTPLCKYAIARIKNNKIGQNVFNIMEPVVLSVLLIVVTAYLVDGSFNPFLYFRF